VIHRPPASHFLLRETLRQRRRKRRLLGLAAVLAVYAIVSHAQCLAHIIGYMHPFDVVPQQVCNLYGCSVVPVQIPCQHPIWGC
jgi:hypothetical protein